MNPSIQSEICYPNRQNFGREALVNFENSLNIQMLISSQRLRASTFPSTECAGYGIFKSDFNPGGREDVSKWLKW